ncbi:ABC transporter permease [Candidatus Pacearchaeota archaeon]|nr:ABC transporter permease [Candidatus Pacearchaeota archaeon]
MKRRKLRSWLTLLGIFIGILAVVSLMSLGAGLREAITGQFASLSVDTLTVQNAETGFGPPGSTAIEKLNDHDLKIIESSSYAKIVIPRLIRVGKIEFNKIVKFKYIASLPSDREKADFIYTTMNLELEEGKLIEAGETGKVVLGNDFTNKEEFDKKIRVGNKVIIQDKEFQIAGIFKKASTFTVNSAILMAETDVEDIYNIDNEFDLIIVRAVDKDKIDKLSEDLKNKLRKDRDLKEGEEDFSVQTPEQSLEAVNTILNVVNIVVIGIALISLLIGSIGITNTMYTAVLERTKEIGTMKAIGARNSDVLILFVIEAGLFGLIGGLLGALFGILISYGISTAANNFLGESIFLFNISWPLVIGAILFSFLIGVIAGIIPSFQASRLKPAEALRG